MVIGTSAIESQKHPVLEKPSSDGKDSSAFEVGAKSQKEPVGSSGTEIFAGYFSEEYLQALRGKSGAKIFDEMRRSESQIAMLMAAVMNPIKSANWTIQPFKPEPEYEKHAELVESCFKEQIDFESFLHEALTFIPFGFSVFEVVHSVVFNHPKFGTFNGLKTLGFRSQKTIESWNLEKKTGKILSIRQDAYGDTNDKNSAVIAGDFLLVFSNLKEGDNYEGISALRPMYGPWLRKNLYLKLSAIGIEKYAVGVPVGTIPSGKEKSAEAAQFKQVLAAYTSHEAAYITKPEGWTIEIQRGEFDASKIKEIIILENTEMVNALVANFLALGMNGGGGAYALGTDLSDFFLSGIQSFANQICGVLNRKAIPDIVKLNFGQQAGYPKFVCTGINDKAGEELANVIQKLQMAGAIKPDGTLEAFLRKQYKLPEAEAIALDDNEEETQELAELRVKLDEKYRKEFDKRKAAVKELMQEHLRKMLDGLKEKLRRKYNAASANDKIKTALGLEAPGIADYRGALKQLLAQYAFQALESARRAVPSKKKLKLAEAIRLAVPKGMGFYDALPPAVKKLVDAQAILIADTQAADIEKATFFQFTSSATSTEDIETILNDIDEKVLPVLDGATGTGMSIDAAAANAVGNVANQASLEFFFEPEVLDEIESFTFTNEDPISDICKELDGTTFAVGDPDLDRYSPPLHHNCKSRLVPNLKTSKDNPEIDRGGLSLTKKALDSITLCEHRGYEIFKGSSS
jgi:SPP1 gp7 family putative phage head morphogenesis protein